MKSCDLLICIRCHAFPTLILDTYDSVKWSCDDGTTEVVCAIDENVKLEKRLSTLIGKDKVYCSKRKHGWGVGLYSLLLESIEYFEKRINFSHFLSIDYDTLFIGKNADHRLLSLINDQFIGLIGNHSFVNLHWLHRFEAEKESLVDTFGVIPRSYNPGEGVQGGCMLLTCNLIQVMKQRGHFQPPFTEVKKHITIADDHLLPLFTRMCGMDIIDSSSVTDCRWNASRDPRGVEKTRICVFHPIKLKPGNEESKTEKEIRNYFRGLRGQTLL